MRNKSGTPNDDISDMNDNTPLSERDADAVLAGRAVNDPALERVRVALASMKSSLVEEPQTKEVQMFANKLASVAGEAHAPATPEHRAGAPWRRRVSAAVAVAAVSVFGVAGVAAADEAAPGDPMYSVDRALEDIGILDGGTDERLDEAQELLEEGDTEGALDHAADALEEDGQEDAVTGLRNAAIAVASQSSGDDVRSRVAEMLQWMSEQDTRGAEFGAEVSERARQLSGGPNENSNGRGNDKGDTDGDETDEPNSGNNANDNAGDKRPDDAGDRANTPAPGKPVDPAGKPTDPGAERGDAPEIAKGKP